MARKRTSESAGSAGGRKPTARAGRFSYEGLDRVMHEKARLGILASLAANGGGLLFNDLKQLCSLTDGNLSRHLAVLTEAGLVEDLSRTDGARPQTMYRLTTAGQRRFAEYLGVLEQVVADAHAEAKPHTRQRRSPEGLSPA